MKAVQKSLSKKFWCMALQDIVEDGHCDCTKRLEEFPQHRDELKVKEFPEHRDKSVSWKR